MEKIIRLDDNAEIDDEDVFEELMKSFNLMGKSLHFIAVTQNDQSKQFDSSVLDRELISTKEIKEKKNILFDKIKIQQNEISVLNKNMKDLSQTSRTVTNLEKIEIESRNLAIKTVLTKAPDFNEFDPQKEVTAIDVCFLIGCTSTVRPYIELIQIAINDTINQLKLLFFNFSLRVALVGYKDYADDMLDCFIIDFLDDIDTFNILVSEMSTYSGSKKCRDIFSGLNEVIKLEWLNECKVLFHICNTINLDKSEYNYLLKKHPFGLQIDTILNVISSLNINYYCVETNSNMKLMIEQFNKELNKHGKSLDASRLHDGSMEERMFELNEKIYDSIVKTIYQNKSKTICTSTHKIIKNRVINPTLPKWEDLSMFRKFNVEYFTVSYLNSFSDIKTKNALSFDPYVVSREIWIPDQPFAKGVLRFAYPAIINVCDGLKEEPVLLNCVIKESISLDPRCNTKRYHEESLEIQVVSNYLARKFEQINVGDKIRLRFLDVDLVKVKETGIYYTIEEFVEGVFKKWSNNEGYVNINDYAHLLNAFSHWTYSYTDEYLIVTDLQGFIYKNNDYILTDPAILSADVDRFGSTNLGSNGIKHFFMNHRCNQICKKLNLKRNQFQVLPDEY